MPPNFPGTNLAATAPHIWTVRLYYQIPSGGILESRHDDGEWTGGIYQPILWKAAPFTPLAAISWDSGSEIRVYYLSTDYRLEEYCYSNGRWFQGDLNNMNIRAARNTSIAAFEYGGEGKLMRVYCQEEGSNNIKEFCHDYGGGWFRGETLPVALSGTSIAAIAYEFEGLQYRVYYQAEDSSIREHCFDGNAWFSGEFYIGAAPGRTQIGVLISNDIVLDVYWVNQNSEINHRVNVDSIWSKASKVVGPVIHGANFALIQWEGGRYIRVYYRSANNILEICKDRDEDWFAGATVG